MGKLFPGDKSSLKQEKKKKKVLKTVPFKQDEKVQTLKKLKKFKLVPQLERGNKGGIVKDLGISVDMSSMKKKQKKNKLLKALPSENQVVKIKKEPEIIVKDLGVGISVDMSSLKKKQKKNKLFKALLSENQVVKIKKEPEIIVKDLGVGISVDMSSLKKKQKKNKLLKALPSENQVVKIKKEPEMSAEESEESESESHVTGENMYKKLEKKGKNPFLGETEAQKEERLKREVFVGNLPKGVDTKHILGLLSKYGEIEHVVFPRSSAITKRSNSSVYVVFEDVESAKKAIAAHGQMYKGRHLIVHMSLNRADDATKKVFIGNLDYDVDEEGLWELFEPCGDIVYMKIMRLSGSGLSRGFAFIGFKESDSVEEALTLNGKLLKTRPIHVDRSIKTVKKSTETLSKTPQKRKIQDSNVSNTENNFVKSKKSKKLSGSDNTSSGKKLKKEFSFEGQKVAENEGVKKQKKVKLSKQKRKKNKLIEKMSDTSKPSKKSWVQFVPASQ